MIEGADHEDWLLYRIADGSLGKKPFDIGGADAYGVAVGVEVKVVGEDPETAGEKPLPWRLFSAHQRWWLNEYARQRALPLVVLYYDRTKEMRVYHLARHGDDMQPRSVFDVGALYRLERSWRGWKTLDIERVKFGLPRRLKDVLAR